MAYATDNQKNSYEKNYTAVSTHAAFNYPNAQLSWKNFHESMWSHENIETWKAVVFKKDQHTLHVAMDDPDDVCTRDAMTRWIIENYDFYPKWEVYYADFEEIKNFAKIFSNEENSPYSSLLNTLLRSSIGRHASDIHVQPQKDFDIIRLRIHGELITYKNLSKHESCALINQLKIFSNVHLTEANMPQSGSFQYGDVDIRTAFQQTVLGESAALRLLPRYRTTMKLHELGMSIAQQEALKNLLHKGHGLIVCCGSTGSGKTTTLYAMLSELDTQKHNIMTLEDPVECQIPGIRQTEIKQNVLGFADGIRALLRHDPDVILIGEIRDADTAQMAVRAAMTGHLVLTTLHTQDVWHIPGRLFDLGVSPQMLGGNLIGAIQQKLFLNKDSRKLKAGVLTLTDCVSSKISEGVWGNVLKNGAQYLENS